MDRPSLRQLSLHSGSEGPREVDPFQMYLYLWTRCVGLPDGTTHEAEGLSVRDQVPIKHEYHDISHDFPNEPSFPESILTREEPNNIRNYPIVKQEAERDCNGYYQLPRGSHNATYGLERFTAMEQVRDLNQHSMNEQWGGYDYGNSAGAEPMSGSEDYGEYYGRGTDNNPKREQKRRPKPKDGTQLICGVCGDKALGYNFDAITCESCKAFFRRNANKTKVFTCSFDGNCKLDTHTRKFCSGCRLKKCFQIGMKKDWILSEEQLAKRRQKGPKPNGPKQRRLDDPRDESMDMPMSSAEATSSNDVMSSTEVSTSYQSDDSTRSPVDSFSSMKSETEEDDFPRPLREDYRLEIENLEHQYAAVFDVPYNEDQFTKLANNPRTPNELFNLTDIFIRRLIKFAKHVPEFKNLQQEDQIHLLKGGIMEIMVLRSAMGFDSKNMAWNVKGASQNTLKEMKLSPDMIKAVDSGIYMEHVRFVMSLNELTRANKTILTLLFVIELFSSDRPSLKNKELVSKGQEKFSAWLKAYLESIYPLSEARQLYPRLLIKLLDVRSLGESSAQLASHLDITRLEPLLVEIFSLQK